MYYSKRHTQQRNLEFARTHFANEFDQTGFEYYDVFSNNPPAHDLQVPGNIPPTSFTQEGQMAAIWVNGSDNFNGTLSSPTGHPIMVRIDDGDYSKWVFTPIWNDYDIENDPNAGHRNYGGFSQNWERQFYSLIVDPQWRNYVKFDGFKFFYTCYFHWTVYDSPDQFTYEFTMAVEFYYDLNDHIDDPENSAGCCRGNLNGDDGHNVLDIVALANCVLDPSTDCDESIPFPDCEIHPGDMNGDGGFNVLDIVALANGVLGHSLEDCV